MFVLQDVGEDKIPRPTYEIIPDCGSYRLPTNMYRSGTYGCYFPRPDTGYELLPIFQNVKFLGLTFSNISKTASISPMPAQYQIHFSPPEGEPIEFFIEFLGRI